MKRLVPVSGYYNAEGKWVDPYISNRALTRRQSGGGQTFRIDYRTKMDSTGSTDTVSGTLNLFNDEIPKYVHDRDLNGEFGKYLRNRISVEYAAQGLQIPQYDIVLRMSSKGGVFDYTPAPYVPLDPAGSQDFDM